MKHILIIGFTDIENDPRVYRQVRNLRHDYRLSTIALRGAGLEGVEFFPLSRRQRRTGDRLRRAVGYGLRRFEKMYWSLYDFDSLLPRLKGKTFDLVIANDVETLPLAFRLAGGARILLDTHEYAPRQFGDRLLWRLFFQPFGHYLCRRYLKECDYIMTVSPGVARTYEEHYPVKVDVLTNASEFFDLQPSPLDPQHIRLISHGVANPNRRLELMIRIMDQVDSRFHLDLMLLPAAPRYYRRLQAMAVRRKNVAIRPPVALKEIVPVTVSYDLSLLVFKPYTVNFRYGLFNKFFESIQARLGIVSGPTPEPQAEIVKEYNCGLVVDSFKPGRIAAQLNRLTAPRIEAYKQQSHLAARQLTAEKNMQRLREIVARLVDERR